MFRIAIEMKEHNMIITVGVQLNGDVKDLNINDLTGKERKEFEEMVRYCKLVNKRICQ